jgi:hypothetical protein
MRAPPDPAIAQEQPVEEVEMDPEPSFGDDGQPLKIDSQTFLAEGLQGQCERALRNSAKQSLLSGESMVDVPP